MLNISAYNKISNYGIPISPEIFSNPRIIFSNPRILMSESSHINISPSYFHWFLPEGRMLESYAIQRHFPLRELRLPEGRMLESNISGFRKWENSIVSPYYPELPENIELSEIEKKYIFAQPERIKNFLFLNKDLIPFLEEGIYQIHRIFGSNISIYLDLHTDPEEGWDELFIVIKSPYDPKKALLLEKKLFEEWFVYVMDKVQNRLNITEEPR